MIKTPHLIVFYFVTFEGYLPSSGFLYLSQFSGICLLQLRRNNFSRRNSDDPTKHFLDFFAKISFPKIHRLIFGIQTKSSAPLLLSWNKEIRSNGKASPPRDVYARFRRADEPNHVEERFSDFLRSSKHFITKSLSIFISYLENIFSQ